MIHKDAICRFQKDDKWLNCLVSMEAFMMSNTNSTLSYLDGSKGHRRA